MQLPITPFEWVANHVHLVGWGTITGFVIWLWRKSVEMAAWIQGAQKRFETVEQNVNVATTNHLSHMESDIADLNQNHAQQMQVLRSIDKNIAVLVDRGRE